MSASRSCRSLLLAAVVLVVLAPWSHAAVDVVSVSKPSANGWHKPGEKVSVTVQANCPAGKLCGAFTYGYDAATGYTYTATPKFRATFKHATDSQARGGFDTLDNDTANASVAFTLLNDGPNRYYNEVQTAGSWNLVTQWTECTPDAQGLVKSFSQCATVDSPATTLKVAPVIGKTTIQMYGESVGDVRRRAKPANSVETYMGWECNGDSRQFYSVSIALEKQVKVGRRTRWVSAGSKKSVSKDGKCNSYFEPVVVPRALRQSTNLRLAFTVSTKNGPKPVLKKVARSKAFVFSKLAKPSGGGGGIVIGS